MPQGSILGPLLFLLYINDLSKVSDLVEFILFADDINIFCAEKDLYSLSIMLNNELHKISTWLKANILSINVDKTKFMIFKTRSKQLLHNFELYFDNRLVNQTGQLRFLGVILDEKLSWKPHILYITNKISKSIGIIRKSSFYLSKSSLRSLYYAMVYPYLYYCNIVWASTYNTNLQRIVRLHKRVIRILNRAKYDAPSRPIFKELKILDFEQIHSLQLGLFMFSFIHSFLPKKYSDMFTFNYQIHAYNTMQIIK